MKVVTREELPNAVILAVDGNLEGGPHADQFYEAIRKAVDAGKKHVLVDLGQAKRSNSAGLGILIRGYVTMQNHGGSLRVFNCSEHVDHMFKITRFNQIIEIRDNEAEARKGL
ncbi:MAG: STAS domain-containing protein [Candidatus Eiseniibacteriota bacterium]|jgi:anti-anti-sigma factor